jgi:DNA-binding transcriptional ArsR family regulator
MLSHGERAVNDIVGELGWRQPDVSKHLAVLKEVGLVTMRKDGRQRYYKIEGERLRPIHDWAVQFERFWAHQLDRIKQRAEMKAAARSPLAKERHP